jgi:mono/diheme cytochrome c family protein
MKPPARPWLALLLTPCLGASARGGEWVAPAEDRARANPVEASPQSVAKGRALYQKHCAMCHGDRGKGDGPAAKFNAGAPEDLTSPDLQKRLTDGEILWKITHGRKEEDEILMPSMLEKIPAEPDRWKVVLFVRELAAAAARVPAR